MTDTPYNPDRATPTALRRAVKALTVLLVSLAALAVGSPAAFALRPDPPPAFDPTTPQPAAPLSYVASHGTAIWVFVAVAAAAVLFGVAITLAAVRASHVRAMHLSHA
ncbi:MAG: hypothetical protein QOE71_2614 [Pseudonocardiales bacterium]|jgi:hypothetical protein|nr:hypothetical protein [Pseudonocardiales bacterium]MDQ1751558.1 hypothetical protein [Pseudonocardiales bacterium]